MSLVAVFLPILLTGGILGRLFREFAVTLLLIDATLNAVAERQVAAANAPIGAAEAAFFPALPLSGAGGLQSTSFPQWLSSPNLFWSVGPMLAQVILATA